MLKGTRSESVHSGIISGNDEDMLMVSAEDADSTEYPDEYADDVTGKPLIREPGVQERQDELHKFSQHNVYTKRPISECVRINGKQPIGFKCIDINKGDAKNSNYRHKLVAKEIKRGPGDDMSAATPALEAKKCLFSIAKSHFARGRAETSGSVQ